MPFRDALAHTFNRVPYLARTVGHVALVVFVSAAALTSQVRWDIPTRVEDEALVTTQTIEPEAGVGGPELSDTIYLAQNPNPTTDIPKRQRREIEKYGVQPNDNVSRIAEKYELKPETILWANPQIENDPDLLSIGQVLAILPINGVYHTVTTGDTVERIAKRHTVEASTIYDYEWNNLDPGDTLTVGRKLIVPGGKKPIIQKFVQAYSGPIPETAARGTGNFGWPVGGVITQKFWLGHAGIDIGAPKGTPVLASDSGYVVFAGWDGSGFGNMILIDHRNGFLTLYGHLDSFAVAVGDSVRKGQMIARVGSTGNSTGPHMDFRIRERGVWRNPFGFLR